MQPWARDRVFREAQKAAAKKEKTDTLDFIGTSKHLGFQRPQSLPATDNEKICIIIHLTQDSYPEDNLIKKMGKRLKQKLHKRRYTNHQQT